MRSWNIISRIVCISETKTTYGDLDPTPDGQVDDATISVTVYDYDPQGIRTAAEVTKTKVLNIGQAGQTSSTLEHKKTYYLIDPANPTGYAQVLEEITVDGSSMPKTSYVIGDDVQMRTASADSSAR